MLGEKFAALSWEKLKVRLERLLVKYDMLLQRKKMFIHELDVKKGIFHFL